MRKPYEFKTSEELHEALGSLENQGAVDRFFSAEFDSIEAIVHNSVAGSTFRAFWFRSLGISNITPSALYRKWAVQWCTANFDRLCKIDSNTEMRALVVDGATELEAHWSEQTAKRHSIGFGRAAKLLNLTIKFLLCLNTFSPSDRNRLSSLLDVPLDSFTLRGIRQVIRDLVIPRNASMGFVVDAILYSQLQDAIRKACGPQYAPVHYEILAWNMAHP